METKKLEVFAKTVELSSLTRAANALGLTQSAVSHIIAGLESELGCPLLVRTRAGARLTPEGETLFPHIAELLDSAARLKSAAEDLRGVVSGEIRIGTFTSVATHWLPAMMKQFGREYPGVSFRLFDGDYHDVDGWLSGGSVDVGFVSLSAETKFECVPLYEDRLLAVLPVGHPLAALGVCPIASIAGEPFISLLGSSDHDARRVLERAGVKPDIKFTTKDDYAIIAMVRQGLGVSILPELLLRGHEDGVEVREIDPPASRTVALAFASGGKAGTAARRFAEVAEEWIKTDNK
jgi:DNA-binding transcriptional LysR family regulator